jgi:hypothetical protein
MCSISQGRRLARNRRLGEDVGGHLVEPRPHDAHRSTAYLIYLNVFHWKNASAFASGSPNDPAYNSTISPDI